MPVGFVYRVQHDRGLAPNPFFGLCSLAVCKPAIRERANVGDIILGTSPDEERRFEKRGVPGGHAIFIMEVTGTTSFEDFHRNHPQRRPNMHGSRLRQVGDAIYHRDPATGGWIQADSLHSHPNGILSQADLDTDVGRVDRVLLSTNFTYWGREAPELPVQLKHMAGKYVRQRLRLSSEENADLMDWARPRLGQGRVAMPLDWWMSLPQAGKNL